MIIFFLFCSGFICLSVIMVPKCLPQEVNKTISLSPNSEKRNKLKVIGWDFQEHLSDLGAQLPIKVNGTFTPESLSIQ